MELDARQTEMMTSAITLSDMEIFIFPELMIAGALANMMSPLVWQWKDDPYFQDMDKLSPYQRVLRVKQYIIDNYTFNLDLETWGLTTKGKERERFQPFVDFEQVEATNALMGYEGDRYYYDIDIRRHFGLENYTTDVLPYWKTETVEAMTAFRRKEGYPVGAGECVSLSMLYYAALHIVAGIPLSQMYMMATPLHSQNFIDVNGGLLTNNRRIVTKSMWFNGTPLSVKAQRALRHEKVTIVANMDGYVHTMYGEGTMNAESYRAFQEKLTDYLTPDMHPSLFYAYLRQHSQWRQLFYFEGRVKKDIFFALAEDLYDLDERGDLKIAGNTVKKLIQKLDDTKKLSTPPLDRVAINAVETKTFTRFQSDNAPEWASIFEEMFPMLPADTCHELATGFYDFCYVIPHLPNSPCHGQDCPSLAFLDRCSTRDELLACVTALRGKNPVADLAFAAYRDLNHSPWLPFLKAAIERNPVSVESAKPYSLLECEESIRSFDEESIYSENRLAQPDEVWNFRCGDGMEKALLFWNILIHREPAQTSSFELQNGKITITVADQLYRFSTKKSLPDLDCVWRDGAVHLQQRSARRIAAI